MKKHYSKTLGGTINIPKEAIGIRIYNREEKLIAEEKVGVRRKRKKLLKQKTTD